MRDIVLKTDPMDHQYKSVQFAIDDPDGCSMQWSDIGTGKSLSALYTAAMWKCKAVLIVCPASVIRSWREQISIHTNLSYVEVTAYAGGRSLDLYQCEADVYIVNYDSLSVLFSKMADRDGKRSREIVDSFGQLPFDCMVIDECHWFGSHKAMWTKIGYVLARHMKYVLMLTGTPIRTGLENLWSQFWVLDGGKTLGKSYMSYLKKYFSPYQLRVAGGKKITKWHEKKESREQVLQRISGKVIRFERADCFDLPSLVSQVREVQLSVEQRRMIDRIVSGLKVKLKKGELNPSTVGNLSTKLRQISGGFVIGSKGPSRLSKNPKLEGLWDCLLEVTGKCIIFHSFVEEGRIIEDFLKKKKVRFSSLRGETKKKDDQIDAFKNDPEVDVLVAHPRSGGEGQNLQVANVVINYSNAMTTAAVRMQTIGRVHRFGQTKSCVVIDILAKDSVDEAIYDSLMDDVDLANSVLTWIRNYRV